MRSKKNSNETKKGRLSPKDLKNILNKGAGATVAHNLNDDNPTEVHDWISTGSRWLDSIICRGKLAGIPTGKIVEIAGLESTGKSYMAAQVAANAQKKDIDVIYFDSESAIDPEFLLRAGCDLDKLIYVQAINCETVLEQIESLLNLNENRMLFIWDSLAFTPAMADLQGDFNPQSSMAVKPRILSKAFQKLTVRIANRESTLLILNQLKTNITSNVAEAMTTPYFTPGGKAANYAYSLRVWLTGRKAKASFVMDDKGFRIGSEVKAKIEKSRFGTQGRQCTFKILWGDNVGIQDQESWLEAIKGTANLTSSGAWYSLHYANGETVKFQAANWLEKLKDEKFYNRVLEIMEEEVILKFDKREGDAESFYTIPGEEE